MLEHARPISSCFGIDGDEGDSILVLAQVVERVKIDASAERGEGISTALDEAPVTLKDTSVESEVPCRSLHFRPWLLRSKLDFNCFVALLVVFCVFCVVNGSFFFGSFFFFATSTKSEFNALATASKPCVGASLAWIDAIIEVGQIRVNLDLRDLGKVIDHVIIQVSDTHIV